MPIFRRFVIIFSTSAATDFHLLQELFWMLDDQKQIGYYYGIDYSE
jgi:hypothetical protein